MKKQIQHESQFIDTKEKRKKSHISTAYKDNKKSTQCIQVENVEKITNEMCCTLIKTHKTKTFFSN